MSKLWNVVWFIEFITGLIAIFSGEYDVAIIFFVLAGFALVMEGAGHGK